MQARLVFPGFRHVQFHNKFWLFVLRIIFPALFLASLSLNGAEWKAAAGRVDITPPLGQRMWGYSDRKEGATSVLDPLWARILVLTDGSNRIALVTLDLGRTFGPPFMDSLRARVKKSSGVQQVFLMASHTHSGPVIDD